MAVWFRILVNNIRGCKNVKTESRRLVHGWMKPSTFFQYKVQPIKPDVLPRFGTDIVKESEVVVLYKRPGLYDLVFRDPTDVSAHFSIFRLTSEQDALKYYKDYEKVLTTLVYTEGLKLVIDTIQDISTCILSHPSWSIAHIAAHAGVKEAFKNPDVVNDINTASPDSGLTPIMAAVLGKKHQCVKEILLCGAQLNVTDFHGDTVYHYAVQHFLPAITTFMKNDTIRVCDWMNKCGKTPLYLACQQNSFEAVKMLIDGGADPSISESDASPIHEAVSNSNIRCIETICEKHRSQLAARDKQGATPLHWAKTKSVTSLLVCLGADVNSTDNSGETPLHVNVKGNREDSVLELLCAGADCNIGDCDGDTPLHIATKENDVEMVKAFVVFGADVNIKNNQRESPSQIAFQFSTTQTGFDRDAALLQLFDQLGTSENNKEGKKSKLDEIAIYDELLRAPPTIVRTEDTGTTVKAGDRVLCLDGGGIRGLVLSQILLALEEEADVPIVDCFDWIGGTSTGGLLALGIAVGKPLKYLKGLYFRLKDQVFQGTRPYPAEPYEYFLQKEFGDKVITEIKHPKVIVTSVLADRHPADLHLFRSYTSTLDNVGKMENKDSTKPSEDQLIWQCCRSTGAAPTYFRTYGKFMDGGLVANNPTLDVLSEIQQYNKCLELQGRAEEIHPLGAVVSVGTGRVPRVTREHIDIFIPEGITDAHKVMQGTSAFIELLINQACLSDGAPVDRARAWCSSINVPYYRFSPQLSEAIPLDTTDNRSLIDMLYDTQCYIENNRACIKELAWLLTSGRKKVLKEGGTG